MRGLGEGAGRLREKNLVFPVGQLIPDLQKERVSQPVFVRSLSLMGNFEREVRGMGAVTTEPGIQLMVQLNCPWESLSQSWGLRRPPGSFPECVGHGEDRDVHGG